MHQAHEACRPPFLAHRHDRSAGLRKGKKKTHRPMSFRTQPGLRFRTCCATTAADKNVVKRLPDLILGAEHDRNQQGARFFLRTVQPLCKGENSNNISISINQHQHQQAKQQSASSPQSSRGPCLIFLGPQHQILQHRHRGHVAGPLFVCPAYWSPWPRCRCGKQPRWPSVAHHHHTTQRPRRLSATLQRIAMGSRRPGSPGARVRRYDLRRLHSCVFCCLRSGLGNVVFCTALHRAAPYLAVVPVGGGYF